MRYMNGMGPKARVLGQEANAENRYNRYVGGLLWSELRSLKRCELFLQALNEAAEQGGDAEETINDKDWGANVKPTTVEIWSTMRDDWEDVFTQDEVRRVLAGWMKLLQMPESEESQVIVDLGGAD